jgi:K+ transporter
LIFKVRKRVFFNKNKFSLKTKDLSSSDEEDEEQPISTISIGNRFSLLTNVSLTSGLNSNEIELGNLSDETAVSVTPCIGCFITHNRRSTPHVFENYLRLLHSIPKLTIFLRIKYARIPFVQKEKRLLIKLYGNIYHISATFGYAETEKTSVYNDILLLAKQLYQIPIPINENQITFFISNQTIIINKKGFFSWINRWPLYIYSIEKSLISSENVNIRMNTKNTIQIGIIAEI